MLAMDNEDDEMVNFLRDFMNDIQSNSPNKRPWKFEGAWRGIGECSPSTNETILTWNSLTWIFDCFLSAQMTKMDTMWYRMSRTISRRTENHCIVPFRLCSHRKNRTPTWRRTWTQPMQLTMPKVYPPTAPWYWIRLARPNRCRPNCRAARSAPLTGDPFKMKTTITLTLQTWMESYSNSKSPTRRCCRCICCVTRAPWNGCSSAIFATCSNWNRRRPYWSRYVGDELCTVTVGDRNSAYTNFLITYSIATAVSGIEWKRQHATQRRHTRTENARVSGASRVPAIAVCRRENQHTRLKGYTGEIQWECEKITGRRIGHNANVKCVRWCLDALYNLIEMEKKKWCMLMMQLQYRPNIHGRLWFDPRKCNMNGRKVYNKIMVYILVIRYLYL